MVLVVVGLSALIAMGGLALDTAHVFLNTARLQTALDAAALAGAKSLDQSTSTVLATSTAQQVFTANLANYPELQSAVGSGLTMNTQFSSTLNPFTPGSSPAAFIKTSISGFKTTMSVVSVLGIPNISVTGTSVAGPSASETTSCSVTPIVMCANPAAPGPFYGYAADQVVGLKQLSNANTNTGIGSYAVLNTGTTTANALAGDYTGCLTVGSAVTTAPSTATTSVCGGLNSRFGNYSNLSGSHANYPPDTINSSSHCTSLTTDSQGRVCQGSTVVTTASQVSFNHTNYCSLNQSASYDTPPTTPATASFTRRVVPVALADCSGSAHGTSATVLGFACLFMLQQVSTTDTNATIYGQVLSNCDSRGKPSPTTSASTGPHTIVLYKSAGSTDS
jgi:hypothetical protein